MIKKLESVCIKYDTKGFIGLHRTRLLATRFFGPPGSTDFAPAIYLCPDLSVSVGKVDCVVLLHSLAFIKAKHQVLNQVFIVCNHVYKMNFTIRPGLLFRLNSLIYLRIICYRSLLPLSPFLEK